MKSWVDIEGGMVRGNVLLCGDECENVTSIIIVCKCILRAPKHKEHTK